MPAKPLMERIASFLAASANAVCLKVDCKEQIKKLLKPQITKLTLFAESGLKARINFAEQTMPAENCLHLNQTTCFPTTGF